MLFDLSTVWGTQSSTELDINDSGDWLMNSARNPNEFNLDVIVKNGTQLIAAEGQTLPAIAPWLLTQLGPGSPTKIDNNGNVFYFGHWDDGFHRRCRDVQLHRRDGGGVQLSSTPSLRAD